MHQSCLFSSTLREAPAEAEAASHRLLLRGGYIRPLAAGIYAYLPLGWRVLRKLERLIREEMEQAGAQELLLPALQPTELWKESGRYPAYGPELIRLKDRQDREFALGPTHEEVITSLVRNEISSYRRLPVILYQIQTKFRDERRPRFGLLRGREFLMKDAYSFDTSWEGLDQSYRTMYVAYERIFQRCGLHFKPVEADAGAIGGEGGTHEFMALADVGEDTIVTCPSCGYAANLEKARAGGNTAATVSTEDAVTGAIQKVHTPGVRTVEELTQALGIGAQQVFKTLIYMADQKPVAVVVRGDHEVNELKVKHYLNAETIELADTVTSAAAAGAPVGFVGPVGLQLPVLVDRAVAEQDAGVVGANETDYHLIYVVPGRDFSVELFGDFRNVKVGDPCPSCTDGTLQFYKGIEVGQVFKLGTKYSEAMGARYVDASGGERPMIMGCYGIGVSRLFAAIAEQHHDERGIVWPAAVAPFQVHLIPVSTQVDAQLSLALALYNELRGRGVEVLLDDRAERAGVKFNDADLLGIPLRVVIGRDAADGKVEFMERGRMEKQLLPKEDALSRIVEAVCVNER